MVQFSTYVLRSISLHTYVCSKILPDGITLQAKESLPMKERSYFYVVNMCMHRHFSEVVYDKVHPLTYTTFLRIQLTLYVAMEVRIIPEENKLC